MWEVIIIKLSLLGVDWTHSQTVSHTVATTNVSGARIFGKHALGIQGKSSGHGKNSLLDRFRRVYTVRPP